MTEVERLQAENARLRSELIALRRAGQVVVHARQISTVAVEQALKHFAAMVAAPDLPRPARSSER